MSVTVTSLVHPTMIAKIRLGLRYAALNHGDKMNGHGRRVYIANAKGHNILRIDWKGQGKFIAYGRESKDVTEMVKEAIQRGCSANRVKPRELEHQDFEPRGQGGLNVAKFGVATAVMALLSGCGTSGAMTAVVSVLGSLLT